jgi:hypothetical protein
VAAEKDEIFPPPQYPDSTASIALTCATSRFIPISGPGPGEGPHREAEGAFGRPRIDHVVGQFGREVALSTCTKARTQSGRDPTKHHEPVRRFSRSPPSQIS